RRAGPVGGNVAAASAWVEGLHQSTTTASAWVRPHPSPPKPRDAPWRLRRPQQSVPPQMVAAEALVDSDRLSALPDSLLHAIMSNLKAQQAVQMGVLAKRWRHLWCSMPCLDVDHDEFKTAATSAAPNNHPAANHSYSDCSSVPGSASSLCHTY
ncbi:unnamed protein product, partial [Urochloa humidicola]